MPVSTPPPLRKREIKKQRPNYWAVGFIFIFFISALVLIFFQSPLSKIQRIEINGQLTLDREEILTQISLEPGVQFFEWDRVAAAHQLKTNPQVKEARVTKVFPGKVVIDIREWERVGLWQSGDQMTGKLFPVLENGAILESPWQGDVDKPLLRDWENKSQVKAISQELAKVEPEILRNLSEIHPEPSETYDDAVRVFTDEGNEVITRIATFHDNINQYRDFIDPNQRGIVHMTYSKDFGWFEPYVKNKSEEEKGDETKEVEP